MKILEISKKRREYRGRDSGIERDVIIWVVKKEMVWVREDREAKGLAR